MLGSEFVPAMLIWNSERSASDVKEFSVFGQAVPRRQNSSWQLLCDMLLWLNSLYLIRGSTCVGERVMGSYIVLTWTDMERKRKEQILKKDT